MKKNETHNLLAQLNDMAQDLFVGDVIGLDEYARIKCAIDLIHDFVPHHTVTEHLEVVEKRYAGDQRDDGYTLRCLLGGIRAVKAASEIRAVKAASGG